MTIEKLYNGGDKPILFRDERTKACFQVDAFTGVLWLVENHFENKYKRQFVKFAKKYIHAEVVDLWDGNIKQELSDLDREHLPWAVFYDNGDGKRSRLFYLLVTIFI